MSMIRKCIPLTLLFTVLLSITAFAYIGNRNSYKFHYDNCSSVYQMKGSNKVYFDNREGAINRGYIPCKRCQP